MNVVHSISFPRSGHKLTTDLLSAYFGDRLVYSGEPAGPGANFIKHHDQDLNMEIDPESRYLVQIRDVFDSMESWHKMTVRLDAIPDDVETFRNIFLSKLDYWSGFIKKWVLSDIPNRVILRYQDLVNNPEHSLGVAIQAFGETPECGRVYKAVESVKILRRGMPEFYL